MITKAFAVNPQNDNGAIQRPYRAAKGVQADNPHKAVQPPPKTDENGSYAQDGPLHAPPRSPKPLAAP